MRGELGAAEAELLQQLGGGDLAALDLVAAAQPAQYVGDAVIGDVGQLIALLVEHRELDCLAALDAAAVG